MINFDTDRLIIFCYPTYAGGKFLINSLGLSDDCVFQDSVLANTLTNSDQKFEYLMHQLELQKTTPRWGDLGLGCQQLFGFTSVDFSTMYIEILTAKMYPIIHTLSNGNRYFFIVAHDTLSLKSLLKYWPNAKVVFYQNYREFVNIRHPSDLSTKLVDYWNKIRDDNWPADPPKSDLEVKHLPAYIQVELEQNYNNEIYRFFNTANLFDRAFVRDVVEISATLSPDRWRTWDCAYYSSYDIFVKKLEQYYKWLGLTEVDSDKIKQYYTTWIELATKK